MGGKAMGHDYADFSRLNFGGFSYSCFDEISVEYFARFVL
jgi:hypothetical protein